MHLAPCYGIPPPIEVSALPPPSIVSAPSPADINSAAALPATTLALSSTSGIGYLLNTLKLDINKYFLISF